MRRALHDEIVRLRVWLKTTFRQRLLVIWIAAVVTMACEAKKDRELLVFAAASTADVMNDVARDFRQKHGDGVRYSFGGSRDLAREIRAGAPADVLVSADAETVDALVAEGFARRDDTEKIASNRLVVIVPKDSALVIATARDLKNASRIAIGDPAAVPAGAYAKKWLEAAGAWADLEGRMVFTIDVRAALAAVDSSRADSAIVYATDASTSARVRVAYRVPPDLAPDIVYVAARLARSNHARASEFVEFLTSREAEAAFARRGFVPLGQMR